jgi:hypothetical protein
MKPASKRFNILNHYRKFGGHGNGIIIKGRVRSGKTTLVSIFVKQLLDNGFAIISNVRFDDTEIKKYAGKLYYITSDLDYFRAYIQIIDDTPVVLVWDDAQASEGMKSTQVMTKQGNNLAKFLIFIGKLQTNYLYIAHQKYIPNVILDGFEPMIIYKLNRNSFYVGNSLLELDNEIIRRNSYYVPLPDLKTIPMLKILSRATAMFEWMVDLDSLFRFLSQYHIGENLKKGIIEFLEINPCDNTDEINLKKLTWEQITIAIYLKRNGKIKGNEKLNQIINSGILYSTIDKMKKGI